MAKWGLRAKSLMALVIACVIALIPAGLVGWNIVDGVRDHFGSAYAVNFTQLNREKILAPLSRELALSRRLAQSGVTREWLLDPTDAQKNAAFFAEAEGYRADFSDHAYFIASARSGGYYFNDDTKPVSVQPRYVLSPTAASDSWFYRSIRDEQAYNINVNVDAHLKVTRVWMNIVVRDADGAGIGLTGASLNLNSFLNAFVRSGAVGVTPIVIDQAGAIQAHPDDTLIAYNSGAGSEHKASTIYTLMGGDGDEVALRTSLQAAFARPGQIETLWATIQGKRQLLAASYVPELRWYVLTAVDMSAARVIDSRWLWSAGAGLVLLIALLLLGFGLAVERLVLRPLQRLQASARAMADGRYDVAMPREGVDEIGDLSRAFSLMAAKVRSHTSELESRVQQRTIELQKANAEMALAHKQIGDSIDYASLIQRAFLPARQMMQSLGEHHFVLWMPRDVVGGDFYVFRADGENCMLGVVDCAGHGVPGALMTMLSRTAIDVAIAECGVRDPAGILSRTDAALRAMVDDAELPRTMATSMDAGLAYIDRSQRRLTYAGAKLALFASDGQDVVEHAGTRRALGSKRIGEFENIDIEMSANWTYYLVTDGFLDQAGGEQGFGFGASRFRDMLREHARQPLTSQTAAFVRILSDYQGTLPQRDDITLLAFRFE